MIRLWSWFAVLLACPCLACPVGESSGDATSGAAADKQPDPKPTPEATTPQPAGELLASALLELSEHPEWLGEAPEKIHVELGLGERFSLHRYSEGMGESERVGFSIRPKQKTEVVASELANALGLEAAAHEQVPITDRNRERLANAGATPFVWKGLQLEIELHERDYYLGLRGWLIEDVLVLPAEASEPEREPEWVAGPRVVITPDEAAAAGLPKLGLSLDIEDTGLSGTKLRDGDYLHLSGPPGGPLLLRIGPATVGAAFAEVISRDHLEDATFTEEQVELLGASRRAAAWVFGESLAKTSWCAVIVAPADAKPDDPALLLEVGVGHSGDAVACKTALEDPNMKPVIASLKLVTP